MNALSPIRHARLGAKVHPELGGGPISDRPLNLGASVFLDLPANWHIRSQGERGTCVAFAAVACAEYHLNATQADITSLSEEFVYAMMKQAQASSGQTSDRTWLKEAAEIMETSGVCLESFYPYDPLGPVTASPTPASPDAIADALQRRFKVEIHSHPDRLQSGPAHRIVDWLRQGIPVAISIPVQVTLPPTDGILNWGTQLACYYGIVADPTGESDDGHAVCITGYLSDPHATGGGWFICRNSWGLAWSSETPSTQPFAIDALPGRGYGAISAGYVEQLCSETLIVTELVKPT